MNTRRLVFWTIFVLILALIVWGLVVAMNKEGNGPSGQKYGTPNPISALDHVLGPENAPVTLIEYSDFQCPACIAYYPVISRLIQEASTTMRFAYRHFPLQQHKNAIPASMAAEAAEVQGKFWEMTDLIFTNSTDWVDLAKPEQVFVGYAEKIGLDIARFKMDLASSTLKDRIDMDVKAGVKLRLDYTPTFFVNGKVIQNPTSYEQFKTIIDEAAKGSTK